MPDSSISDQLLAEKPTGALSAPALPAGDAAAPGPALRLEEKRLAAERGVSRTPVREALARLEHEGLVRILPRRGVDIVRKTKAEIVEMIIAWGALEATAARLACERATDEEIASLRSLIDPGGDEYTG